MNQDEKPKKQRKRPAPRTNRKLRKLEKRLCRTCGEMKYGSDFAKYSKETRGAFFEDCRDCRRAFAIEHFGSVEAWRSATLSRHDLSAQELEEKKASRYRTKQDHPPLPEPLENRYWTVGNDEIYKKMMKRLSK